jgi:apolipoprotein D and lipocalin family protein
MLPTLTKLDSAVAEAEGRVVAADQRLDQAYGLWRRRWTDRLPLLAGVGVGGWLLRMLTRSRGALGSGRQIGWRRLMRPALSFGVTRAAAALTAVAAGKAAARQAQPVLLTVTGLDLDRFAGLWYELGRLAPQASRTVQRDVTVQYALVIDGGLRILTMARDANDRVQRRRGRARLLDPLGHACLRVSFAPSPFDLLPGASKDFWVLDVAADYSVAVLGTADRGHLVLLARTPHLPATVSRDFLLRAQSQGYSIGNLIFHVHEATPAAHALAAA